MSQDRDRKIKISRLLAWINYKIEIIESSTYIEFNKGYQYALNNIKEIL